MPDRVEVFDITCAASVAVNNPTEVVLTCPPGIPRRVTIWIPDGHAGLTGIALGYGHQPILPRSAGAYISGNDETPHYDLHGYPAGPVWSAFVCNLDLQEHRWEVRMEFDEIPVGVLLGTVQEIPATDITTAGEAAMAGT